MDSSSQSAATAGTGVGGNGMISSQANDTAATTAVDDPKQNLNQVINSIQKNL
jgi:mediator of RNA polymerase II transcription subunit 10